MYNNVVCDDIMYYVVYMLSQGIVQFINPKAANTSKLELHFCSTRGMSSQEVGTNYTYGQRQARLYLQNTILESTPRRRIVYDAKDAGIDGTDGNGVSSQLVDRDRLIQTTALRTRKPVYADLSFTKVQSCIPADSPRLVRAPGGQLSDWETSLYDLIFSKPPLYILEGVFKSGGLL